MRDYELTITLLSGEVVKIVPELRVQFEVNKSIKGGPNNCKLKIYNLSQDKRNKLIKDQTDKKVRLPFLLKAGYDRLETIFRGNILEASSVRSGSDFITTISSVDGGHDYINSFTSKTVKSSDPKHILEDMKNTKRGKITKIREPIRPRVLVGRSAKIIEDNLADDETMFIDDETMHIIKDDEVIDGNVVVISAETGLLETPTKKAKELNFKTLLNPNIKIGGVIELKSTTAVQLNGVYRVNTLKYSGDNYGTDWTQECSCVAMKNYKVLK